MAEYYPEQTTPETEPMTQVRRLRLANRAAAQGFPAMGIPSADAETAVVPQYPQYPQYPGQAQGYGQEVAQYDSDNPAECYPVLPEETPHYAPALAPRTGLEATYNILDEIDKIKNTSVNLHAIYGDYIARSAVIVDAAGQHVRDVTEAYHQLLATGPDAEHVQQYDERNLETMRQIDVLAGEAAKAEQYFYELQAEDERSRAELDAVWPEYTATRARLGDAEHEYANEVTKATIYHDKRLAEMGVHYLSGNGQRGWGEIQLQGSARGVEKAQKQYAPIEDRFNELYRYIADISARRDELVATLPYLASSHERLRGDVRRLGQDQVDMHEGFDAAAHNFADVTARADQVPLFYAQRTAIEKSVSAAEQIRWGAVSDRPQQQALESAMHSQSAEPAPRQKTPITRRLRFAYHAFRND